MRDRTATLRGYFAEIVSSVWSHPLESAVVTICAGIGVLVMAMSSSLHPFVILLPAITAAMVFQGAVAAWRIYRRQTIVIATTRALVELGRTNDAG